MRAAYEPKPSATEMALHAILVGVVDKLAERGEIRSTVGKPPGGADASVLGHGHAIVPTGASAK
jgi:hypothetical protein